MNILLINYQLGGPETSSDYEELIMEIKTYNWCKVMKSVWVIKTNKTTTNVRDHLKGYLDANDMLFVNKVGNWASYRLPKVSERLKS